MAKKPKFDNDGNELPEEQEIPGAPAIDPMAVLASLASSLKILADNTASQRAAPGVDSNELMAKLAGAMDRIAESQMQGAQLMASETRRAHRPSNEVTPNISVFNRRGTMLPDYQKPLLKCIMLLPWLAEWESLNREEVELLNLLESGVYTLVRVDRTKVKVTVKIEYGVDETTPSRLLLNHDTAFNNDNFRLMPSLSDMLRQVLKQHEGDVPRLANAVLGDDEEEAMIAVGELSVSV